MTTATPDIPRWNRENPFAYCHPTVDELEPFIGKHWSICRATPANIARYGNCISHKRFKEAERKAIEARGWARPVEKVLRDLLDCLDLPPCERRGDTIQAARETLLKAREETA